MMVIDTHGYRGTLYGVIIDIHVDMDLIATRSPMAGRLTDNLKRSKLDACTVTLTTTQLGSGTYLRLTLPDMPFDGVVEVCLGGQVGPLCG